MYLFSTYLKVEKLKYRAKSFFNNKCPVLLQSNRDEEINSAINRDYEKIFKQLFLSDIN